MSEQKNLIIVGSSFAGLSAAHYFFKHVLPSLPDKESHHVTIIDSSKEFMFRFAVPRAVSSTKLMPTSEFFFPIEGAFQKYNSKFYTIIHGRAISLDTTACCKPWNQGDLHVEVFTNKVDSA